MPERKPPSPSRRPGCLGLTLLITLGGLCLAMALVAGFAVLLPARAAQSFGPPATGLPSLQQMYYAFLLVRDEAALTTPLDPSGQPRPFVVELGEPTSTVIEHLYLQGLIADPDIFRIYLLYSGKDTSIQAGEYDLSPAMPALQIALAMQDATPSHVRFGILPGWRLEEIAAAMPTSGLAISSQQFLSAAGQPLSTYQTNLDLPATATLEGLLFPDTYRLPREITAAGLVQLALENLEQKITPDLIQAYSAHNLDAYQALILASMVQREAIVEDEMPQIASVFHNRLAAGMKLDSDPTVQYALGFNAGQNTWWTNPLSATDLQIDSPYNTYLYPGFPPAPIASPGLSALHAVAFPAETPFYYFRAACDGSGRHVFAQSLGEHIQNACP
jgi:UPF0755 protein